MPLETATIDLAEEVDRLDDRLDDLADEAASIAEDNPHMSVVERMAETVDSRRRGVTWALETWDVDAITLSGLTGGEYAQVEDNLAGASGPIPGSSRIWMVARGTVDAPYVADDLEATVANVADLPLDYQQWAYARINDMTTVGEGNLSGFWQRVEERRQPEDTTES